MLCSLMRYMFVYRGGTERHKIRRWHSERKITSLGFKLLTYKRSEVLSEPLNRPGVDKSHPNSGCTSKIGRQFIEFHLRDRFFS